MLHRSIERKAERTACIQYSIETLLLFLPYLLLLSLLLHLLHSVYLSIHPSTHFTVHPFLCQPLHHCINLIPPPVQLLFLPFLHLLHVLYFFIYYNLSHNHIHLFMYLSLYLYFTLLLYTSLTLSTCSLYVAIAC